jgi:serine/threonine-protein kinase
MEQFGRYRLDELIGTGGMGEVYRAYDPKHDRTVAIKRLLGTVQDPVELRNLEARFNRESRRTAQLSIPHIVPVHEFGDVHGRPYIEMAYVQGRDLHRVIEEDGPLPPPRAVSVVEQLATALDAAHAHGLVHRDVKSSNALLQEGPGTGGRDFVYLLDFGIAQALDDLSGTRLSRGVIGTDAYMAPERLGAPGRVDHRVDVYALGCLLFECLTGRPPYVGDSPAARVAGHLYAEPPRPGARNSDLSTFDPVVQRALAKHPDDRFQTAGDLAHAAAEAWRSREAPVIDPEKASRSSSGDVPPTLDRRPEGVPRRKMVIASALAVLAAAGTVTAVISRDDTSAPVPPVTVGLDGPWSLAVLGRDDGLLVSDSLHGRVVSRQLDSQTARVVAGRGAQGMAGTIDMGYPTGLAVAMDGTFYVADSIAHRVYRMSPEGSVEVVAGTGTPGFSGDGGPAEEASLNGPHGLALDLSGGLLIADTDNHRVRRVGTDGLITTVYGSGSDAGPWGDGGPAAEATISRPEGLAFDREGALFITQWWACLIRRVDRDGTIATVAGMGAPGFSGDGGPAQYASLNGPSGIGIDAADRVVFADFNNNRLRRIERSGTVVTVVGSDERGRSEDGATGAAALLSNPTGVAASSDGSVYIADYENDRIVRVDPDGRLTTVLR